MAEQGRVETTTLTFEYFRAYEGIARCVHTEVVEVFGLKPEQCFVVTEDGDLDLHPTLEKEIYPVIKHDEWEEKTHYHTISHRGSDRPAWWFEHVKHEEKSKDEETEADETVIEIDRKTGKVDVRR